MRKRPYPVTQLTKGLDVSVDASFLTDQDSPNLEMVRFHRGLVKKDLGFKAFASLPERVMLIDTYYKLDGSSYLMALTLDECYQYDPGEEIFERVSGGGPEFTGDEDDIFHSISYNDLFIVTNGNDNIKYWDGSIFGDLAGSPPKAKNLTAFYDHLILGHTIEAGVDYPLKIQWSVIGDPTDWTGAGSGYFHLSDTPDWVIGFALLGDRLYVFKERSIWEITHVGGTDVFSAQLIMEGIGTIIPGAITSLGDEILFYGQDNFYLFDGSNLTGVGDKIFPYLYETGLKKVNLSKLPRAPSVYVEELGDFWVVPPTSGDEPDWFIKYNIFDKNWTQRDIQEDTLGDNLLINSGFEDFTGTPDDGLEDTFTGWFNFGVGSGDMVEAVTTKKELSYACKLTTGLAGCAIYQNVSVEAERTYRLSFWTRGDGAVAGNYAVYDLSNGKDIITFTSTEVTGTVYQEVSVDFTTPTGCAGIRVYFWSPSQIGAAYFDFALLREVKTTKHLNAFGFWSTTSTWTSWLDASGAWMDSPWSSTPWKERGLPASAPTTLAAFGSEIVEDNRITTSSNKMTWETKDFTFGHAVRVVEVRIKCKGSGGFSLYYSTDKGRSWTSLGSATPDADDFKEVVRWMNLTCQDIRFRLTTSAEEMEIMWIEPWYVERARSKSLI